MKNTLELGVYEAVATFNDGNITKCKILERLGFMPGSRCRPIITMTFFDEAGIQKAEKAMLEIEKR